MIPWCATPGADLRLRYLPSHLPALTLLSAHQSGRAMTLADQSSVAPCAMLHMLTVRREARSDLVGPCALNAPSQPCKTDTGKRLAEVDANDDDSSQTASRSRNKRQRPLVSNDLEPCVATSSAPKDTKELDDRQLRFVVSSCPLPIASSQLPVRLQNVRDCGNCVLALMRDAYKFISARTYVLASNIFDKFLSAYVREVKRKTWTRTATTTLISPAKFRSPWHAFS